MLRFEAYTADAVAWIARNEEEPDVVSTERHYLQRLSRVLQERGAPLERVLGAVTVSGTSTAFLGVAVLSKRVELRVPVVPTALAAVAPTLTLPPLPPRGMLRLFVDGDTVEPALMTVDGASARVAVDDLTAPGAARGAWFPIVDTMLAIAPAATIFNRTQYLAIRRGEIAISYPERTSEAHRAFMHKVDGLGELLGLRTESRHACQQLLEVAGGGPISIATAATEAAPAPYLSIVYGYTSWERAIEYVKLLVDEARARSGAATLGTVAAALDGAQPRGVEVVLEDGRTDLLVWFGPQPGGS